MVTISTLPVLILIAILWRTTRGEVLSIVLFASAFTAASAFNLGSLGVEPWLLGFVICILVKLAFGMPPPRLTNGLNSTALVLFVLFVLYAVGSAILSPFLFKGVTVVRSSVITPLSWSTSNLAQSLYLVIAGLLYLITISRPMRELENAVQWYIRACVAASCVSMYQLANAVLHIPYPSTVFYSNPTYVIYNAYQINGMWRLNGPFCEASEMASFLLAGVALLGWELMTRPLQLRRVVYFALMVLSLLMTLSSVGYACLIIMAVLSCGFYGYAVSRRGVSPLRLILALALVGGIAVFFAVSTGGLQTVNKVINSTLLDKSTSDSYKERTETHDFALQALADTNYVGAGWGSLRASGLAYILLGTLGLPGTTLFLAFYLSLFLPLFRRSAPHIASVFREKAATPGNDLFARSLFAATILICGMLIAGSEPVAPALWVLFGIATAARPQRREFTMSHTRAPAGAFERETISVIFPRSSPIQQESRTDRLTG